MDIEYEITDPAEDGSISADAGDAGWITDINCDTDGVITFSAAANDTEEERQATITVTYTYNGTETVSDAITVSQPPVPTITITTEDPLALAADALSTKSQIPPRMEAYPRTQETPVGLQTLTAIQMGQ